MPHWTDHRAISPTIRCAVLACAAVAGLAIAAVNQPAAAEAPAAAPTNTALINLIRLLVQEGVITPEKAELLLNAAQAEAATGAPPAGDATPAPGETVHVPYIPEPVRRQIRDEVKQEVLKQAQAESWAAPNEVPKWVSRITPFGDLRFRYERDQFGSDNGPLVNFNAINTGQPVNTTPGANDPGPPALNTNANRNRYQLRARTGLTAKLDPRATATIRVATGNNTGPVSTNQTLGYAPTQGSGGNFSKYNLWLDQAYVEWRPIDQITLDIGRFPNPYFHTDLIWDSDVNFDGIAARGHYDFENNLTPFITFGAFPVYNTDFNFSTYDTDKESSRDRYLLGGQVGLDSRPLDDLGVKFGVAYYHFVNMQGQPSNPCLVVNQSSQCNSDISRPQFAQNGNTYFRLRNITPTTDNVGGTTDQYQYFGLLSEFNELALTVRADLDTYKPIHVIFDGEFVKNLGLDNSQIRDREDASQTFIENNINDEFDYKGGDLGFLVRGTVGYPTVEDLWEWNVSLAYKYLESDAVVDGLADSDFGLGGTNSKGFILGGNLGLSPNIWVAARWLSSQEIVGPRYSVDVFQADLNARF